MAEPIKCNCSHCGAKYRLPSEAAGRTARCKRCGEKFEVPREATLEDSILTWLSGPSEDEDEAAPAQPRVISMPSSEEAGASEEGSRRARGTIRMKSNPPKEETA